MIISPVKSPVYIKQHFGENVEYYRKLGSEGHSGIDFAIAEDTKLYAPIDGKVVVRYGHENYGHYVKIKNERLEVILAHINFPLVKNNDFVFMGDPVALSGKTGKCSYPHLHFGVRHVTDNGKPVYPNNGHFGWEDLEEYIICWKDLLKK